MAEPKIKLRAFERTDLDRVHKLFNNPELLQYLSPEAIMPVSREEEAGFIENCVNPKDKESHYNFAIENAKGELIGGCGYDKVSHKNRTCYIGISIYDKHFWGKGYGTAALRELLSFLFFEKNLRKVLLSVYSFNQRAITCYKKVGFRQEGCLKEQIYRNGKYHDLHVMAVLADDYAKANGR